MTAAELSALLESEIDGNWSLSNAHGVDLRRCLVEPQKRMYRDSMDGASRLQLWLVLEEDPASHSGYEIVFDDQSMTFGLATGDLFLGLYGTFLETLENM